MSTLPSTRRLRERGFAGGRGTVAKPTTTTTKSLTPLSDSKSSASSKISDRKENSVLRGAAQKPWIKPIPRIGRPADGTERKRWSMSSSVPRGRSSSPSEFGKIVSDLRCNRVSRVSRVSGEELGSGSSGRARNGVKVLEKKRIGESDGVKGIGLFVENVNHRLGKCGGKEVELMSNKGEKAVIKSRFVDDCENKKPKLLNKYNGKCSSHDLNSNNGESCVVGGKRAFDGGAAGERSVEKSVVVAEKCDGGCDGVKTNDVGFGSKKLSGGNVCDAKRVDFSVEKGSGGKGIGERSGSKYPSRLHEKLALLEGKVRRIASDIKKTKEMLDKDNSHASKEMISDIQEKISGIEKAMSFVKVDSSKKSGGYLSIGNDPVQQSTRNETISVKEMNTMMLEACLFPHHKLLRDRTSIKERSLVSDKEGSMVPISGPSTPPADENPISLEFWASQREDQREVISREIQVVLEGNEVQETAESTNSVVGQAPRMSAGRNIDELDLRTDERLEELDDQENQPGMIIEEDIIDDSIYQLNDLGCRASTGGWFVQEGASVLLAHDDGSCSFYDIANNEEKAVYKPPSGISPNVWRDCWLVSAAGADGSAGKYVVAASAGNTMDAGFCSWDLYTKKVQALHVEEKNSNTRVVLGSISENIMYRRYAASSVVCPQTQNQQWWYRPCGPLMISTASGQRVVKVFDVRDGEQIMKWDVQKPVLSLDYSSPLQWRSRAKVVIAEADSVSLWDVNSLSPEVSSSVSVTGGKVSALHINHTDPEVGGGGGVRQRVSSSEAEGHDGVFCMPDSTNVIDFRERSGIGLKIPMQGVNVQSVFSRGDSVYVGCSSKSSAGTKHVSSQVQQFSLRKQRLVHTYVIPESNAHPHHTALTQVWGNSNLVIGVSGLGLFIFDALNDEELPSYVPDYVRQQKVREVIGPDNLYAPSFDYVSSQVLLISRDRPAMRRLLP